MLEKIYYIILPEVDQISCKLGLHEVQLQNHMFCSLKIKKDMESELSGIFGVKLVAKSITELSLQCDVYFRRNLQMLWMRLLYFSVSLVK